MLRILEKCQPISNIATCLLLDTSKTNCDVKKAGVSEHGGRGTMPPPMLEEGARVSFGPPPQKKLGGLGSLGLVFFTLENVLCLLFESALYLWKKA